MLYFRLYLITFTAIIYVKPVNALVNLIGKNMKRVLATTILAASLSACSSFQDITDFIPSFWDDNQSAKITDVYVKASTFGCDQPHLPQITALKQDLLWFELYSKSKGYLQKDVIKLIAPMQETVDDFYKRSKEKEGSKVYCEAKKKILITQAKKSASGVMWRF